MNLKKTDRVTELSYLKNIDTVILSGIPIWEDTDTGEELITLKGLLVAAKSCRVCKHYTEFLEDEIYCEKKEQLMEFDEEDEETCGYWEESA